MRNEIEKDKNDSENKISNSPLNTQINLTQNEEKNRTDLSDNLSKITESDHDEQIKHSSDSSADEGESNNYISLGRKSNVSNINFEASKFRRQPLKILRISEYVFPDQRDSLSPDQSKYHLFISGNFFFYPKLILSSLIYQL